MRIKQIHGTVFSPGERWQMIPAAVGQDGGAERCRLVCSCVSRLLVHFSNLPGWLPLKFLTHTHTRGATSRCVDMTDGVLVFSTHVCVHY